MATDTAPSQTSLTGNDDARPATTRVLRTFSAFIAVGYLIYGTLSIPLIIIGIPTAAPWWTPTAVALTVGTGLAMGPLAWRAPIARLRVVATINALGYVLAAVLWWTARTGELVEGPQGIWIAHFPGLAAIAAVVAFRAWTGFVVLAILTSNTVLIDDRVHPPGATGSLISDIAWGYVFSMVFVAGIAMGIRAARILDDTRAQVLTDTAIAAATQARAAERSRFEALTHDNVMSTLLVASRHGSSPELARDARSALNTITAISTDAPARTMTPVEVEEQIRIVIGNAAQVTIRIDDQAASYPGDVAGACALAAAEAVRNAHRHAGPDIDVTVSGHMTSESLLLSITDDGLGFNTKDIPPERLGISLSIYRRMETVGGRASITSIEGRGTDVLLSWPA